MRGRLAANQGRAQMLRCSMCIVGQYDCCSFPICDGLRVGRGCSTMSQASDSLVVLKVAESDAARPRVQIMPGKEWKSGRIRAHRTGAGERQELSRRGPSRHAERPVTTGHRAVRAAAPAIMCCTFVAPTHNSCWPRFLSSCLLEPQAGMIRRVCRM